MMLKYVLKQEDVQNSNDDMKYAVFVLQYKMPTF